MTRQRPLPVVKRGVIDKATDTVVTVLAWLLLLAGAPFSFFFCIKIVAEYERAVIFRLGRLVGSRGPGLVVTLPLVHQTKIVDLRVQSFDVPLQEMLTKDSLSIAVTAAVYYRMTDPIAALTTMKDPYRLTRNLTQTTLRIVIGTRSLGDIIGGRQQIAQHAKRILDRTTKDWGIRVDRLEMRDIRIPRTLCRVMAREAEATRISDALFVKAEGERQARTCVSHLLKSAADSLASSRGAVQLRFIDTLSKISLKRNHTLVVPMPADIAEMTSNLLQDAN